MAGWGESAWGESFWGFGEEDALAASSGVTAVNVYASDLLEVTFGADMKNNSVLQNVDSWSVIGTTEHTLLVKEVLSGSEIGVDVVYLVVSLFNLGEQYTVTASVSMVLTTGESLPSPGNTATFIGRRTKIDSLISTRPPLYNLSQNSTIRHIMNAIGHQDDLIGGNKSEGGDIIR